MSGSDGHPLEALRDRVEKDYRRVEEEYRRVEEDFRRVEEEYRLDVAAIEHLQRRFFGGASSIPTSNDSQRSIESNSESPTAKLPPQYTPERLQSDGLEDSLRSMFKTSRG
jgi:hypothetical protein